MEFETKFWMRVSPRVAGHSLSSKPNYVNGCHYLYIVLLQLLATGAWKEESWQETQPTVCYDPVCIVAFPFARTTLRF